MQFLYGYIVAVIHPRLLLKDGGIDIQEEVHAVALKHFEALSSSWEAWS
jgi:hypothetical protein